MRIATLRCFTLTLLLLAPGALAQDAQSPLERARELARQKQLEAESTLQNEKGEPILPGQLPAAASAEAKQAWKKIIEKSGAGRPIRSFDLSFVLRQRDPEHPQTNDLDLRFGYLVPGYVRAELESGRTLVRGPRGDYLIDAQEVVELVGREGLEDIKQIDQMASLARNFVALSDPRNLRLTHLEQLATAPTQLPTKFKAELKDLQWMRVVSPDFFLRPEQARKPGSQPQLYSVAMGVDRESNEIRFAVVQEQRIKVVGEREVVEFVTPTSALVRLTNYADRNGFHVPHQLQVFGVDGLSQPWRFSPGPTSELFLRRRGSLRADLAPENFQVEQ